MKRTATFGRWLRHEETSGGEASGEGLGWSRSDDRKSSCISMHGTLHGPWYFALRVRTLPTTCTFLGEARTKAVAPPRGRAPCQRATRLALCHD